MHTESAPGDTPMAPTRRQAFLYWLKLGFVSFGGPAGQIAIMHEDLVERRRWISENRFLHALNYCMVLPGPEAQQLATYIGWLMHRTWGGIVAGGLFVLPSLFILVALSWVYLAHGNLPVDRRPLLRHQAGGDRAGGARGLPHRLAGAQERRAVGHRHRRLPGHLRVRMCAFPFIVLAAGFVGLHRRPLGAWWVDGQRWDRHGSPKTRGPALIDDHTPTPEHARFSWQQLAQACCWCAWGCGLAIGGLAGLLYGWDAVSDADGLVLH
jgi:chromate transporter